MVNCSRISQSSPSSVPQVRTVWSNPRPSTLLFSFNYSHHLKLSLNFAAGFFGVPEYTTSYRQLIIDEEFSNTSNNNTLAAACANSNGPAGKLGSKASGEWAEVYLKGAVERLNGFFG